MDLTAVAESGHFEQVMWLNHAPVGLTGYLAVHNTGAGPAIGGIRFWSYPNPGEALRDCLRLAQAMTYKCLLAGVPAGGGKVVILEREGMDRRAALEMLGRYLEAMGGRIITGPDLGTSPADLEVVSRTTGYVVPPSLVDPAELGLATALGVVEAMRATSRVLGHEGELEGLTVAIQGAGRIGGRLARLLVEEGVRVLIADPIRERTRALEELPGLEVVDPGALIGLPCDFLSPCARGGVIHDLSMERLRCRAVVGSANNQLAMEEHGEQLHRRGILFAPDFVANAGDLIQASSLYFTGSPPDECALERIGLEVEALLLDSLVRDIPPSQLAQEEAERRLGEVADRPYFGLSSRGG